MTERATLPAGTVRTALLMARALTIALRSWSLYPGDHPAVGAALDRLSAACGDATRQGPLSIAVTPATLLIDGVPLDAPDHVVQEAAGLLYDRDLLQLLFLSAPPDDALRTLLTILTLDREARSGRPGATRSGSRW
jgi:hypothetical protein